MDVESVGWNRRRYDLLAPFYDLAVRPLRPGRRRAMELLAPRPGERLLLVGVGTGLDLPLVPAGVAVAGVDVSPRMLRRARNRAAPVRPELALADGARLPFRDGAFDCVALHLILAVIPNPEGLAREVARVLKPEGRVGVFDKFLPEDQGPSSLRTAANAVARVVATDINRRAEPLLAAGGLESTHDEPSLGGGFFRVLLARPRGTLPPQG